MPCLAAYDSGVPVGLLHHRLDDAGNMEAVTLVAVQPRRGIGTALLGALAEQAETAGCRRVWLVTTNDNTAAQHFYRASGWTLLAVHVGAVTSARALKPEIPLLGEGGVAIEDELEYELMRTCLRCYHNYCVHIRREYSMPCIYCGNDDQWAGQPGCSGSPTGTHVIDDPNKCRFCGNDRQWAGQPGCSGSPTGKHILANGSGDCVFCGADSAWIGQPGCSASPSGTHAAGY